MFLRRSSARGSTGDGLRPAHFLSSGRKKFWWAERRLPLYIVYESFQPVQLGDKVVHSQFIGIVHDEELRWVGLNLGWDGTYGVIESNLLLEAVNDSLKHWQRSQGFA